MIRALFQIFTTNLKEKILFCQFKKVFLTRFSYKKIILFSKNNFVKEIFYMTKILFFQSMHSVLAYIYIRIETKAVQHSRISML